MMDKETKNAAKQDMIKILANFGITDEESLDCQDDEEGAELYEDLKAGILEPYDLDDHDMELLFEEIINDSFQ